MISGKSLFFTLVLSLCKSNPFYISEVLRDVCAPLKYRRLLRWKVLRGEGVTNPSFGEDEKTLFDRFAEAFLSFRQKISKWKDARRGNERLLGLWASHIKIIEGKYGSGVGTYFRFLRALFALNVFISLVR